MIGWLIGIVILLPLVAYVVAYFWLAQPIPSGGYVTCVYNTTDHVKYIWCLRAFRPIHWIDRRVLRQRTWTYQEPPPVPGWPRRDAPFSVN